MTSWWCEVPVESLLFVLLFLLKEAPGPTRYYSSTEPNNGIRLTTPWAQVEHGAREQTDARRKNREPDILQPVGRNNAFALD